MFGIGAIIGLAGSIYSGYRADRAGRRAAREAKRRFEQLGELATERIDYRPITEEELQAYADLVDAQAEVHAVDTRRKAANVAAEAGYDPQEVLGQLEPAIQRTREQMISKTISDLKAQDLVSARQHEMQEDLRILQNEMAILGHATPEEIQAGVAQEKWSRIASVGIEATQQMFAAHLEQPQAQPETPAPGVPRATGDLRLSDYETIHPTPTPTTQSFGGMTPEQRQDLARRYPAPGLYSPPRSPRELHSPFIRRDLTPPRSPRELHSPFIRRKT